MKDSVELHTKTLKRSKSTALWVVALVKYCNEKCWRGCLTGYRNCCKLHNHSIIICLNVKMCEKVALLILMPGNVEELAKTWILSKVCIYSRFEAELACFFLFVFFFFQLQGSFSISLPSMSLQHVCDFHIKLIELSESEYFSLWENPLQTFFWSSLISTALALFWKSTVLKVMQKPEVDTRDFFIFFFYFIIFFLL